MGMRIGLISDTHGHFDESLKNHFSHCDEIWHGGDIGDIRVMHSLSAIAPLIGVHGNIDGREVRWEYPEEVLIEREGFRILLLHIGGYPGSYAPGCRAALKRHKPDMLICGHSHILRVMRDPAHGNMWVLNPGAAGIHGFHPMRTVLRFCIQSGKLTEMEVIELGKRSAGIV